MCTAICGISNIHVHGCRKTGSARLRGLQSSSVVEPRCELSLTHEALEDDVVVAQAVVEHLDDRLPAEQRLLASVDLAEPARADALAYDELAQPPAAQLFAVQHLLHLYHRWPDQQRRTDRIRPAN
jgi:hypothetical protein